MFCDLETYFELKPQARSWPNQHVLLHISSSDISCMNPKKKISSWHWHFYIYLMINVCCMLQNENLWCVLYYCFRSQVSEHCYFRMSSEEKSIAEPENREVGTGCDLLFISTMTWNLCCFRDLFFLTSVLWRQGFKVKTVQHNDIQIQRDSERTLFTLPPTPTPVSLLTN